MAARSTEVVVQVRQLFAFISHSCYSYLSVAGTRRDCSEVALQTSALSEIRSVYMALFILHFFAIGRRGCLGARPPHCRVGCSFVWREHSAFAGSNVHCV